jgi:hypothetical protein
MRAREVQGSRGKPAARLQRTEFHAAGSTRTPDRDRSRISVVRI